MSVRPVLLSARALTDLDDIWDWIAAESLAAADRTIDELGEAIARLGRQPGLGRARPELMPGIRSHPHGRYVIFYRAHDVAIEVVRVLHGSRDIDAIF